MYLKFVDNRKDLKRFIKFPEDLYRNDSLWAPPLWKDEKQSYSGKTNPILKNSDYVMFLALEGNHVLGRNLVYIDHSYNSFYADKLGFFGAFETLPDQGIALELLRAAEEWIRAKGMRALRGPINPAAENWGFLFDGFSKPPIFMSPYNPKAYNSYMEYAGYKKAKDLLVYEGDMSRGYQMPKRFLDFSQKFLTRNPGFSIRKIDPSRLEREAEIIWQLSNESLSDNWGYVPVSIEVMKDMVAKLKPIIDPNAIWFVESNGSPVGFCLGFPDLNILLKRISGRLFPFGFLTLLRGIRRLRDYRLFGLAVHPKYQGLGLDVLLYVNLHESLKEKGIRLEANYILEDNYNIKNALEKLALKRTKTYRIYEKPLA